MAKYVIKKSNKLVPSDAMKKIAHVKNKNIYKQAAKNPIKFWEKLATEGLDWEKKWTKAYEQKLPYFKWFKGGKINFSKNCLDRHLENKSDKVAITWVPEPTKEKTIKLTYKELHEKVCKFANVLKKHKIKKGDVVSIFI